MTNKTKREQFVKKILTNSEESTLKAYTLLPQNDSKELSTPLTVILNLDTTKISKEGNTILDILENDPLFPYRSQYRQLKWNILALISVQDIFPGTIYNQYNHESFFAKNYFYYEGIHLIREYFYTGFNNFLKASDHLVRTILEFHIRHCYFHWKCEQSNSYLPITDYLKNGVCPSNHVMINKYLSNDTFSKPIKSKIQSLIRQLSNTSSHAFNPEHSIRGNGKMHFEYTMDSVLFWLTLNGVLSTTLWSYFACYPMLLHPKDIIKKFGYNPPLGLFISNNHFTVFRNALDKEDLEEFVKYTGQSSIVNDLISYYNGMPNLLEDDIQKTWSNEDGPIPDTYFEGYIQILAKMRISKEMLANRCTLKNELSEVSYPEAFFNNYSKYTYWKNIYSKIKP